MEHGEIVDTQWKCTLLCAAFIRAHRRGSSPSHGACDRCARYPPSSTRNPRLESGAVSLILHRIHRAHRVWNCTRHRARRPPASSAAFTTFGVHISIANNTNKSATADERCSRRRSHQSLSAISDAALPTARAISSPSRTSSLHSRSSLLSEEKQFEIIKNFPSYLSE